MPPHHIQNFASQSGLRPPHLSLRFTGQSILLRKTVYDRPVFFGVHTCAVNNFRNFSVSEKKGVRGRKSLVMTFVNESNCVAVPSCTVSIRNSKSFLPRKDNLATCKAAKRFCKNADRHKPFIKVLNPILHNSISKLLFLPLLLRERLFRRISYYPFQAMPQ